MLPVYEAVDLLEVLPKEAGRNMPWVILADTPAGLQKYVVKLYTSNQIEKQYLTNEVICNALARDFELQTPTAALINFPANFELSLSPYEQLQFINADPRLKFASKAIENPTSFVNNLPRKLISKRISIDTLYAFDNLIRNKDRGAMRTNLVLSTKTAYLIDHELALTENEIMINNFNDLKLNNQSTIYHSFYPYLKRADRKSRMQFFGDFEYYITECRFNSLQPYFQQLRNEGFNPHEEIILNWLNLIMENYVKFAGMLKASIN